MSGLKRAAIVLRVSKKSCASQVCVPLVQPRERLEDSAKSRAVATGSYPMKLESPGACPGMLRRQEYAKRRGGTCPASSACLDLLFQSIGRRALPEKPEWCPKRLSRGATA